VTYFVLTSREGGRGSLELDSDSLMTGELEVSSNMNEPLESYMAHRTILVNDMLTRLVGESVEWPTHLHRALCYSLFPGGKRLRPILAIAGYEALATVPDLTTVLPVASAAELLHTYTLIHDDLPQMDDDDLRRGKPTSHRVHGEALAILAGDGLQAMAFQVLTNRSLYSSGVSPEVLLDIAHDFAKASGIEGVVGGQSMDLGYEGEVKASEQLAFLFGKKTGDLIRVSIVAGAKLGGGAPWQLKALSTFGDRIGLAFQIVDDLVDESDAEPRRVTVSRVPSIVEIMGVRGSQEYCARMIEDALRSIEALDDRADNLRRIARWIPDRKD